MPRRLSRQVDSIDQTIRSRLDWTARKLTKPPLAPEEELLDFMECSRRRFGENGADKPVAAPKGWLRAVPFLRGLTIVTYTREQVLFLATGFAVNCALTAVHRVEIDADDRQTFVFARHGSPLSLLELKPVDGNQARRFLDGLLTVRDEELRKLPPETRTAVEERNQLLLGQSLEWLWEAATNPRPRTNIGQWLRAGFTNDQERMTQLRNSSGPDGGYDDEFFVVATACHTALHKLFPAGPDRQAVTAFVADLRSQIHGTAPPEQAASETLILSALGDPNAGQPDLPLDQTFFSLGVIANLAVRNLGLDAVTIDKIIVDAEQSAFAAGKHPAPAPPSA